MNAVQLNFFEPYDEFVQMKMDIHKIRLSTESVRRGVFARVGDIAKHTQALYDEIDALKIEIAKMKKEMRG